MIRYALAVTAAAILFAAGWTLAPAPAFAGCGGSDVAGEDGSCTDVTPPDETTSDENGVETDTQTTSGDDVTEADTP